MNAKNFSDATEINYYITDVNSKYVTSEWICSTYSQRNWVEVFYREAKGLLGLREYQVRDKRSLKRHFIFVFCAYKFIIWHQLTGGGHIKSGGIGHKKISNRHNYAHLCDSLSS